MPLVSVAICVSNSEKYIADCLNAILTQTFSDFELIIVADPISDRTYQTIRSFSDKRIRFFVNEMNIGLTKSRNKSLSYSKGEYVFFTDSDCTVARNWIEEGLKNLRRPDCIGVEGIVYYVSKAHRPTFSDHLMENRVGGNFLTANIAYKKEVLQSIGGFDEKYTYHEDRDIAFRAVEQGELLFNPKMIVYHQQVTMTPNAYLKSAGFGKNRVYLFKKYGDKECIIGRFYKPANLVKIFFPPLILLSLFFEKFNSKKDFLLLPYSYFFVIKERLLFWRECAKEREFLI